MIHRRTGGQPAVWGLWAGSALLCGAAYGAAPSAADIQSFEQHIRPVLANACYGCHGAEKQDASLRLDRKPAGAVLPSESSKGTLLDVVLNKDKTHPAVEVAPESVEHILDWLSRGAPWPADPAPGYAKPTMERLIAETRANHWSFQPIRKPEAPEVDDGGWGRSPIDAFVAEKLTKAGLEPSPQADKRTLLRRLHYDLTGLPPTYDAIVRFETDKSPDAFGRAVDDLLASPRFGERWARHWLDVARYSDTRASGFEDTRFFPFSYTYRDYVIRALNEDLPYDEFIVHQLAADELELGEDKRPLAALGFLTLGRPGVIHDMIDDQIDVVTRGFMGLTVNCARCHDHKFDPIPTADYYALYGILRGAQTPEELPRISEPDLSSPAYQEYAEELAKLEAGREALLSMLHEELVDHSREHAAAYLQAAYDLQGATEESKLEAMATERGLRAPLLKRWRDYVAKSQGDGAAVQLAELADGGDALVRRALDASDSPAKILPSEVAGLSDQETRLRIAQRRQAIERHKGAHPGRPDHAMAVENAPKPFDPFIFVRGDAKNQGEPVPRRFLTVLAKGAPEPIAGHGRLEMARAIASEENPLTARVFANRVWMHLMGRPLVGTPSDFGLQGDKPTHPELLDYLAATFMENDWSVKGLIREIVLSSAYQQRSDEHEAGMASDPDNALIWRQNRRRLDFEAMRDSVLNASGNLDLAMGGPAIDVTEAPFSNRRTVYGEVDREDLPGMYRIFDFAAPNSHSPNRFQTTVPQQGLFMMNSPFVAEQARLLAARAETAAATEARIAAMYRAALSRDPLPRELELGTAFIDGQETAPQSIPYHAPSDWKYGYGTIDAETGRVTSFTEFPHWTGDAYQGDKTLPAKQSGLARLDRLGGHPGGGDIVAIRRWVSPASATLACMGELHHYSSEGDGIAGYVISSRQGLLWKGEAQDGMTITVFDGAEVREGDTIDLIVASKADEREDTFRWHPRLYLTSPDAGKLPKQDWLSRFDFAPPPPTPPAPLKPWEQYAQVLLMSNEFMFVD